MTINGTTGDDHKKGTGNSDIFDLSQGGVDTAEELAGDDFFLFGTTFGNDHVYGGKGSDQIQLNGNYDIALADDAMFSVETLLFEGAYDYSVTLANGNVAANARMAIVGALTTGHNMIVNAVLDTDSSFDMYGSAGNDSLSTGENGNDVVRGDDGDNSIDFSNGIDRAYGGAGADVIHFFENGFDANDRVDGGDDIDTLFLVGAYPGGLTITKNMMVNVEHIFLHGDVGSDDLTFGNASLPTNVVFVVDASQLGFYGETARLDGSGAKNYFGYELIGGRLNDVLIGAKKGDSFTGGLGVDTITSGGGPDVFHYNAVAESTGKHYDTITDFDAHTNAFMVVSPPLELHTVDPAVVGGKLSTASFDKNLQSAIGAGQLDPYHAVLFTPANGSLAGQLFLIVDANGIGGYQGGADVVIHLPNATHIGEFDSSNFIPVT